jgi:hypothetical protein
VRLGIRLSIVADVARVCEWVVFAFGIFFAVPFFLRGFYTSSCIADTILIFGGIDTAAAGITYSFFLLLFFEMIHSHTWTPFRFLLEQTPGTALRL